MRSSKDPFQRCCLQKVPTMLEGGVSDRDAEREEVEVGLARAVVLKP